MDKPHKFLKDWFKNYKAAEQARVVQARKLLKLDAIDQVPHNIILPATRINRAIELFGLRANLSLGETTIEGKSIFANPRSFVSALQKKGFARIGSGAYGTVLMHPKGTRVIKVVHRPQYDGWPHYVKWAADTGYAGTFAPKVFAYKNIGKFAVATMEKLDQTVSEAGTKSDVWAKYHLFEHAGSNELLKMLADLAEPGLAKFSEDFTAKFRYANDLHEGNVMSRKGQVVITDPLSSWREGGILANWKLAA